MEREEAFILAEPRRKVAYNSVSATRILRWSHVGLYFILFNPDQVKNEAYQIKFQNTKRLFTSYLN